MIKKTILLSSLSLVGFSQAQDISVIRNTADVYSHSVMKGNAKFDAMVGSNGALGGEASSLNTNPAGLGVAVTNEFSASLQVSKYNNTSALGNKSLSYDNTMTSISNVSGTATLPLDKDAGNWKFVNLGINYSNRSLDNYVETPGDNSITFSKSLIDSNNNPVTGNLAFEGHAYNRIGEQSKLSLGVGANYDHTFYFGAGLNFHNTNLEQFDLAALSLDLDDNNIHQFDKQYTPYNELSSGFSASVGVIGKISNQLRFGLSVETPTWWRMERIYNEYAPGNNGYINYEEFTEERRLQTPLKTTLSAAVVPNKNFAINVDYTVGLSKTKFKELGDAEKELNEFFNNNTKNTSEIKVGAEYRYKSFRLRGGYAYADSPFESMTMSSVNTTGDLKQPLLASRNTLGLGIGFQFRTFYIDAAYQNISYSTYQNPFMQGFEDYNSGYYSGDFDLSSPDAIVSDVDKKQNNITISLGWRF